MNATRLAAALAAAFLATGAAAQQAADSAPAGHGKVLSAVPRYTDTMKDLLDAAQRLREAVQVMATQAPSAERDKAMRQARRALMQSQRAMVDLPPGMRATGDRIVHPGDEGIEAGQPRRPRGTPIQELRDASDRLLEAVGAMSRQPAGVRRDDAIADAHLAWNDAHAAMVALTNAPNRTAADSPASGEFAMMVGPITIVSDERLNDGCWARVYENPDFGGSSLTLVGPVSVARLDKTVAGDWNGADSIVTGSKARVALFDDEGYRERVATVQPGERVANLHSLTGGVLEAAESLRVSCTA